jgi:hypothetical protein
VHGEYRDSREQIESNVPGARVDCMAYPWGSGKEKIAAEYYIACRGVAGVPNVANRINYNRTGSAAISPDTVDLLLTGEHRSVHWLNRPAYRRAWLTPVYHYVRAGRTVSEKDASQARVAAQLAHLASRADQIWVGLFRDVACYAMERDTARLEVTMNSSDEIRLQLTDDMHDALFDYPLTIKVRVPDAWTDVRACQQSANRESCLVQHQGARFVLVKVIPDRGEVCIRPAW